MFIASPPPPPPKPIIVWVHGTRGSSFMPWVEMNKPLKKRIDSLTRTPKGLHPLANLNQESKSHKLLTALSEADPEQFPYESIYAFGWSGKLDGPSRKKAAQRLYAALGELTATYKRTYGIAPPIILISHSHGGNVILHMAPFYQQYDDIAIKKTVLIACPVQQDTASAPNNPLFGKVYSLHSHVDIVQIMDPQRLQPYREAFLQWQETKSWTPLKEAYLLSLEQPLFSERHFPTSSRLIQANICWNSFTPYSDPQASSTNKLETFINWAMNHLIQQKRGVLHSEFITPEFIQHLPVILTQLDKRMATGNLPKQDIDIVI
ncbi:alpha/beta hydrolase [Candidatus Dependentiae bacterium]|nr:MAG: alpha/beta hydrolase [Candidatus Dependentiae bacterium]